MTPYQAHMAGDCNPWSCVVCDEECPGCMRWRPECTCPTLPLDEEDES